MTFFAANNETAQFVKKKKTFPFLTSPIARDLSLLLLLTPIWWLLGVRFIIFHLIVFFLFIKMIIILAKNNHRLFIPIELIFLGIFIVLYIISLLSIQDVPIERVVASIYNLSFWIMGFFLIILIYNQINEENIIEILKSCRNFGLITSLFVIGSFVYSIITEEYHLRIKSLMGYFIPLDPIKGKAQLIADSLWPLIVAKDWIYQKLIPRPFGFNAYPTAMGATMVILISLTLAYYAGNQRAKFKKLIISLELMALILSFTRIAVLGLFLGWLIVATISKIKNRNTLLILAISLMLLTVILISVPLDKFFYPFYSFRPGSTQTRLSIYKLTINFLSDHFLFGYGYKPRPKDFDFPIASHSTYLSVLYRTGLAGFLALCLFFGSILFKWLKSKDRLKDDFLKNLWYYNGISLIGSLIWLITEDLDAPTIAAYLFFMTTALIATLPKWLNREE
jgi:O-antigen ligase